MRYVIKSTRSGKVYKIRLYELGAPVITFNSPDILKTFKELKEKGVDFKKDPKKINFCTKATFDGPHGIYLQ